MRNLGIKTSYFKKIEKCLSSFPYYKNKKINGYMILCAYAKYLTCYKPPITNFDSRIKAYFGANLNQMQVEFLSLKKLFGEHAVDDFSVVFPKLLRFAMADVVGDVQGVLDALRNSSYEEAIQHVVRTIVKGKEPSKMEYIEEESTEEDIYGYPKFSDVFSDEQNDYLRIKVENIIIESSKFHQIDDGVEVIEEFQSLFPNEQLFLNEVITAYRASDITKRRRTISEKLYSNLMQIDALDFLDAILQKSGFINIMVETGFVYELITSPLDLDEENNHVLIFDASIQFLNKWLTDEALDNVRTTFVFSNPTVASFAKVSKRFEKNLKRKPKTKKSHVNFLYVKDWVNYIKNSVRRHKIPKVTTVYMNYIEKSWEKSIAISDFNNICLPHLADEAILYYFNSLNAKKKTQIQSETQFENSLKLNTYARISGITCGPQNQTPLVVCYTFGSNPPCMQNQSQVSFQYSAVSSQEGILISLNAHSSPKTQYMLSELPLNELQTIEQPQNQHTDSKKADSRNNIEIIKFSPEIHFKMRKKYKHGKLDGIEACCHGPSVLKARKSRGMKQGPRIVGSLIGKQIKDEDTARMWTMNEYPYLSVTEGTNKDRKLGKKSIREIIGAKYTNDSLTKECSLRTFYYVNPKLDNTLSNRKKVLLKKLMMSRVGLIRIKDCCVETLSNAVATIADDTATETVTEYLELVHLLLQHAVSLKYIAENSMQQWANTIKKIGKVRRQSREALGKNSLSKNQLKGVYKILKNNMNNPKYLGLMIQLFTGLSAREVCALTLDSIHQDDIRLAPVTLLKITHESTSEGELLPFDELHKYRWIPCVKVLKNPLIKHYEQIKKMNRGNNEDKIKLLTYLNSSCDELANSAVLPQELRDLSRKIIRDIGIEPHIIRLSDEVLRDKRTDINIYYGEILKSNFEFYNRRKFGLLPGEYRYLVGNVQLLVKDKNYIDYSNVHSQLNLFDKLEKWSKFIRSEP